MVPVEMATVHVTNVPGIDRVVAELPKPELPPSCLDLSGCLFTLVVLPVNFDGWRVLPSHHRSESDHTDIALDSGYVHRCRANHDLSYILLYTAFPLLTGCRTFFHFANLLLKSIDLNAMRDCLTTIVFVPFRIPFQLIFSLLEFFLEHSDAVI